jgi:hypothetical protein
MVKCLAAILLCTALSGCIIQPLPPGRTVYYVEPAYAPPPVYYAPPPPPRYFAPGGGYGYGYGPSYPRPHHHFRPWR